MDISHTFKALLARSIPGQSKTEIELAAEDMEIDFQEGEEVDLDEIIREQIHLFLPMKFICREDCSGLCPTCGVNLNNTDCRCRREKGHPAFKQLTKLTFKETKES